jgi:hypothetical protein
MRHGDAKLSVVTGVRWKGRMGRRWVMRVAWMSLIGLWGSLGWGPGAVSALPIDYFALGDSVASGYGLADDETACHQSMLAYPWQLEAPLPTPGRGCSSGPLPNPRSPSAPRACAP